MSLTLDALTVLDAIDRKGSFAAAAAELYRVPSAVSYTIQKLEQDLDISIFDRSGHRARLTPAGKSLLEEGRHLINHAHRLESHVKRVATGWETELHIAIDTVIASQTLFPLLEEFYRENSGTRLHLQEEVLGGTWDALVSGRADLVIGVSGDRPTGAGFSSAALGEMTMIFAVSPQHPLASAEEPIKNTEILQHRAVAVADTSRSLPPRSAGLLSGQDVLTVADMQSKLEAQCQGLGIGYLPGHWAAKAIANGQLQEKKVDGEMGKTPLYSAWRSDHQGKALKWFISQLEKPEVREHLLSFTNKG